MAEVTDRTVAHIARLARLSLTEEERGTFARQLAEILAYAESIQKLDTQGVEPMSHTLAGDTLREDRPGASLPREAALAEAPDAADGLFRVPRILGG